MVDQSAPILTDHPYPYNEALVYQIAALPMTGAETCVRLRPVIRPEFFAEDPDAPLRVVVDVMFGHAKQWGRPPSWEVLDQLVEERIARRLRTRKDEDAAAVRALYRQTLRRLRDADVATNRAFLEARAVAHAEDQALGRALLASAEMVGGGMNGDRAAARSKIQKGLAEAFAVGAPAMELGMRYSEHVVGVFDAWRSGEFAAGKIATGWTQIDARLEGGFGHELVVIAGQTGAFKTGVCVNLGAAAMAQGRFVAHASLEGEAPVLLFRYGRRVGRISKHDVRGTPMEDLAGSLLRHRAIGGELAVKYFRRRKAGVEEVESWLAALAARGRRPDMLIVDYADKMAPPGRHQYQRDDLALSAIYDELEGLSHDFPAGPDGRKGITVVTPSQVQKGAFGRRIVTAKDVAGAVDKAAIAHIILAICQTPWEARQAPPVMRLFIAKAKEAENLGTAWFHQHKDASLLEECPSVDLPDDAEKEG